MKTQVMNQVKISDMPHPERRVKRGWMNLLVSEILDETHDTKTFLLVDADDGGRPYDFYAGQYLTFRFDEIAAKPLVRSYTMSGSPLQKNHSIFTVKRVENGIVSNWLCDEVRVGSVLRARGPIGRFCFDPRLDSAKDFYMVAGGSGVTPFISILREYGHRLGDAHSPKSLNLLVAYRSSQDLISVDVLKEVASLKNVNLKITLTREKTSRSDLPFLYGRPDSSMIKEFLGTACEDAIVMTCGPQEMMDLCCEISREKGLLDNQIRTESFFS